MKFHEMTSAQLASIDRRQTLVVLPIAAVEQHGPHMPTGTDTIICGALAEALEARLPQRTLLAPTFWLGASAHHLRFGSTLDCDLGTYIDALYNMARSLLDDGYMRLLFLNGHGGNVDPMRVAMRRLQRAYAEPQLAGGSYWSTSDELIRTTLTGEHKSVGHACELETSLMLHLRPDLVDETQLVNAGELVTDVIDGLFLSRDMRHRTKAGFTGRPDLASAEKGKRLFDGIIDQLVSAAESLLKQPLGAEYSELVGERPKVD